MDFFFVAFLNANIVTVKEIIYG